MPTNPNIYPMPLPSSLPSVWALVYCSQAVYSGTLEGLEDAWKEDIDLAVSQMDSKDMEDHRAYVAKTGNTSEREALEAIENGATVHLRARNLTEMAYALVQLGTASLAHAKAILQHIELEGQQWPARQWEALDREITLELEKKIEREERSKASRPSGPPALPPPPARPPEKRMMGGEESVAAIDAIMFLGHSLSARVNPDYLQGNLLQLWRFFMPGSGNV